ncbi:hypothetical protein D2962_03235 [Biomaibacter acetigenes]|uniref:Uncharacterized protein n=1 Tax=Biomaibacter acetigenes TaxID=2316383 RepID=A0A3G2R2Q6_9FIRM|nr:PfkB family carbohydrate kinase [Biomaibacter acetigenes]AYO29753.1 hypothetical protein D2962_03235 [Biomaibacter acetigenes]RKL61807.1 hypothetical protein DXT63_14760 [Thermoanaerobacteraceae bacterium SP2]
MPYTKVEIIESIEQNKNKLGHRKITVGFDGYVDEIVRPVKLKENNETIFFKTIEEFAQKILASAKSACDIEIISQAVKIGGNAPIMANALSTLGVRTFAVGAFGYPEVEDCFKQLDSGIKIYSMANPGYSTAFEFQDGKIMFGKNENLNEVTWDRIKNILGKDLLKKLISDSFILAVTNWSSLYGLNDILKGIISELSGIVSDGGRLSKYVFFDIADPSRRSTDDIVESLNLMAGFKKYFKTVFSFNENEARIINRCFFEDSGDMVKIAENIFDVLKPDLLVIHPNKYALLFDDKNIIKVDDFNVENPVISTGGGDNFNAGFCAGLIMALPPEKCVYIGRACASFYIKNGSSPSLKQLIEYIKNK